jgi:branched-chain amino acid aminotransferase
MDLCYINGDIRPAIDAKISVWDRGFLFGDAVFETIRVLDGVPVFLEDHLQRLYAGLQALSIKAPAEIDIRSACKEVMRQNSLQDGMLRLTVTRGIGSQGYLPTQENPPSLIIGAVGVGTLPHQVTLWQSSLCKPSPDSLPLQHKLTQGINSTLARLEAQQHEAEEALLLSAQGMIAEAAGANLFWKKGNTIYTPSLATGALAGVTRQQLLRQWQVEQGEFALEALKSAEAVILTNRRYDAAAVKCIQPAGWEYDSLAFAEAAWSALRQSAKEYVSQHRAEWLVS